MRFLVADDEEASVRALTRILGDIAPDGEIRGFLQASEAVKALREQGYRPDVAFLDIQMPGMTGLQLASILKTVCPRVNIIFATGYSEYALEALALRPSGYLMKPITKAGVLTELENLRDPPARTEPRRQVCIRCFGSFEVFSGGVPVSFLRAKSKEMLAFLVDRRGSACSSAQIAEVLWEDGIYDRSRQKQLSVIRTDLVKSLRQVGAEKILLRQHDTLAVDPCQFDCDYYMSLQGDTTALNTFTGEYMSAYSWAECTASSLFERLGGMVSYDK